MRSPTVSLLVVLVLLGVRAAAAQDVVRGTVSVNAQFASRTSLKVSSQLLRFDVVEPGATATATIEFSAGARMSSGSDIVLTVEPMHAMQGPGGAADVETSLRVSGEGQGLVAATVSATSGTVIGRWQGSGLRAGRLVFALRANATGSYTMPVRFILSTP